MGDGIEIVRSETSIEQLTRDVLVPVHAIQDAEDARERNAVFHHERSGELASFLVRCRGLDVHTGSL